MKTGNPHLAVGQAFKYLDLDFYLIFSRRIFNQAKSWSDYCTILFAQLELAKASGLALKAKPIPMI